MMEAGIWRLIAVSLVLASCGVQGGFKPIDRGFEKVPVARPQPQEHARMARWLVHSTNWATVSTQSTALKGFPYGNAVAISDGPLDRATGRIFFYLTDFDQTAIDLMESPKATVNIAESQIPGECVEIDPEDPRCAKVTLIGEIMKVPDADIELAKELMFKRHPQMKAWMVHKFTFYELHIGAIRLLDYYGGYEDVTPEAYFAAWLVLEEMKSDPCWKFPHRFYCVEDRYEVKKKKAKRTLAHRRPDKSRTGISMEELQEKLLDSFGHSQP